MKFEIDNEVIVIIVVAAAFCFFVFQAKSCQIEDATLRNQYIEKKGLNT